MNNSVTARVVRNRLKLKLLVNITSMLRFTFAISRKILFRICSQRSSNVLNKVIVFVYKTAYLLSLFAMINDILVTFELQTLNHLEYRTK